MRQAVFYIHYNKYAYSSDIWIIVYSNWKNIFMNIIRYHSLFYNSILLDMNTFEYNQNLINKINDRINVLSLLYHFYLPLYDLKLTIASFGASTTLVNSYSYLFYNLLWAEREMHEMFGINFLFKKDNRKLLLDYSLTSFPMLKSFPVSGLIELFYSFIQNFLIYVSLGLFVSSKPEMVFDF